MNLLTKYSFVAMESYINTIAMDEYLLKSNIGGETGRKLTGGTEVIQWNSNTLHNTQGKKMKKITLKYPTTTAPSKEEMNEIIKASIHTEGLPFSSKEFDAFSAYAEESHEEYKNPIEALESVILVSNSTPKCGDQSMDTVVHDMQDFAVKTYEGLAAPYKKLNDEEKLCFDLYARLKSEVETRAYLQLAIELAQTPYQYYSCATLAAKLFGEEEVIFELYKKAISILEDSVLDFLMERDIKESNLNVLQKNELLIQLHRESKSCS